jgi:hypothetical protein
MLALTASLTEPTRSNSPEAMSNMRMNGASIEMFPIQTACE